MDESLKEYYGFNKAKPKKKSSKKIPNVVKRIQSQVLQPFDYTSNKSISFSQLSTYLQCAHKWELHYKQGLYHQNVSIELTFGTALHNTLQYYITQIYETSGAQADKLNLEEHFEEMFRNSYLQQYKDNNKIHFSDPEEMNEYFEDGLEIIRFIKKKRNLYFSKKGTYLLGCEIPILIKPNPQYDSIFFKGFIDVAFYNEALNKFTIIDIKTSKQTWGSFKKNDKTKQAQLLLYKKFFSEQFNIPIENIHIEFFIVKRKLYDNVDFPQSRIQTFSPSEGKTSINQSQNKLDSFLENCFNLDGSYQNKEQEVNISLHCQYCPYNKPGLCKKFLKTS